MDLGPTGDTGPESEHAPDLRGHPGVPDREMAGFLPIGDVVAGLQSAYPDVTHSSLRFLEREGLVDPARTPGGHRVYSAADVALIHRIKRWQAQRLSLAEIRQRLEDQSAFAAPPELAASFLAAALRGDAAASRLLVNADDVGMPLVGLFRDVLRPALAEVGERWAKGKLRVGQEHEITEVAREVVSDLAVRHAHPDPQGPAILAACVAGERHDLGLRMIVALLRASGRVVHFLGADVDARIFRDEVTTRRPAVVLLSATLDERLSAVEATVAVLRDAATPQRPTVVLGGRFARGHRADLLRWGVVPADDEGLDDALATIHAACVEASPRT